MKSASISLSVVLVIGSVQVTHAARVVCPPYVNVQEKLATDAPAEWNFRSSDPIRYLGGVTLFDGDPVHQVSLVPDTDRKTTGKERIATWRFTKSERPIWLSCSYDGTGVTFTRPLPDDVRSCTLLYAPSTVIKKISCQ